MLGYQNGNITTYTYDQLGELLTVTEPAVTDGNPNSPTYGTSVNPVTAYAYDAVGNQISQTDANGNTTKFAYDVMGRKISRTLAMGQTESWTYDANGNMLTHTDFNGRTTTYTYNALNQLATQTPDAYFTGEAPVSYTYTPDGQIATMTDGTGTTTYTYDHRNDLTEVQSPEGTLFYTYDLQGNETSVHSGDGNGINETYTYDSQNSLSTVVDNNLPTIIICRRVQIRPLMLMIVATVTEPNGVVTTYSYNSLNRLTDEVVKNAVGNTLASYSYTLDNAGNRTGVTETQLLPNGTVNTRTVAYTYDNLYRLLSETTSGDSQGGNGTVTYTYDLVGNRMSRTSNVAGVSTSTSTYPGAPGFRGLRDAAPDSFRHGADPLNNVNNEPTQSVDGNPDNRWPFSDIGTGSGTNSLIYVEPDGFAARLGEVTFIPAKSRLAGNANGNTTKTSNGTTTTTFMYDSQNRLVKQDAGTASEIDITYDGGGNKVSETVGGVTTKYLIDSNNPTGYSQIVEEIVNGVVTRRYTLGRWIISETQNISGTWATSFYGYDGHNSVRFLTNSSGAVTDNYTFDAFGNKIAGAGTTPNQILYSGEFLDPGTSNYDLRAREYNSNTGAFTTMDTTPGQLPYVYTADNPVMFADPSGHGFSLGDTLFTISFQMSMIATQIAPAFQAITTVGTLALLVTDQNFAAQYIATGGNPIDLLGSLSEETMAGMRYLAEGSGAVAAIGGEIYAVVVDAQRAEQYLANEIGLGSQKAEEFISSFRNGGIVARIAEPGETFLRYYGGRPTGNFLTRLKFGNPAEAIAGLNLGGFGNDASLVQVVTVNRPTIIFEGGIAGGSEEATQFFATDISAFQFGQGTPYGN